MQNNLKKGSNKDKKRKQQNLEIKKKTGKKKSKSLYIKMFPKKINKIDKLQPTNNQKIGHILTNVRNKRMSIIIRELKDYQGIL